MLEGHALGAGTAAGKESLRIEGILHSRLPGRNRGVESTSVKGRRRVIRIDGIEIAGRVGFVVHLSLEAHPLLGLGLRRCKAGRGPGLGEDGNFITGTPEHLSVILADGTGITVTHVGDKGHQAVSPVLFSGQGFRRATGQQGQRNQITPIVLHRPVLLKIDFVVVGFLQSAGDGITQAEGGVVTQVHDPDRGSLILFFHKCLFVNRFLLRTDNRPRHRPRR